MGTTSTFNIISVDTIICFQSKMLRKIPIIFLIFFFCNPLHIYGALKPRDFDEFDRTGEDDELAVSSPMIKGAVVGNQESEVSTDRLYVYITKIGPGILETIIISIDGVYEANIVYDISSEDSDIVELEFPTERPELVKKYKQKHLIIKTEFRKKQTSAPIIIVSSWNKFGDLSNHDLFVYFNKSDEEYIGIEVPSREDEKPSHEGVLEIIKTDKKALAYNVTYNSFVKLIISNMFLINNAKIIREIDWESFTEPLGIQLPND